MRELVRYCSKCGSRLLDKAVVCVKCGHRVPSANFRTSNSVSIGANSKKTGRNIIIGIYGFSGALGVFCTLVPVIGAIIISICLNIVSAGIILILAGGIYLLVERGLFGWVFLIVGVLTTILVTFYRFGLFVKIIDVIDDIIHFRFLMFK